VSKILDDFGSDMIRQFRNSLGMDLQKLNGSMAPNPQSPYRPLLTASIPSQMITSETFRNRKESSDKFEGEATNCDPKYQSFGDDESSQV